MLPTPIEHLPRYYPDGITWAPEWSRTEQRRYAPIWTRAFEIHRTAHDFEKIGKNPDRRSFSIHVINPIEGAVQKYATYYCDCYEQAYQEFKKSGKLKELGIEVQTPEPAES